MDPDAVLLDLQQLFIKHGIGAGTLAIPTEEGGFLLLSHSMTLTNLKQLGHSLTHETGVEVTRERLN